jgi:hypothetical protein
VLQYTPEQAREFNVNTFNIAHDGYLMSQGVKPAEDRFVSRNEMLDLVGK